MSERRFFWGGRAVAVSGISSLPFEASFEEQRIQTQPDGSEAKKVEKGRILGDSAGRIRKDVHVNLGTGVPDLQLAIVFDPTSNEIVFVDGLTGGVLPRSLPSDQGGGAPLPETRPSPTTIQEIADSLPERVIEGFVCHLVKTANEGEISETWISKELAQVVEETRSLTSGERVVYRLYDIRRGEPDPSLFAPLLSAK